MIYCNEINVGSKFGIGNFFLSIELEGYNSQIKKLRLKSSVESTYWVDKSKLGTIK